MAGYPLRYDDFTHAGRKDTAEDVKQAAVSAMRLMSLAILNTAKQ
jgi:hypothetical protein